jgi:integrase
MASWVRAGRGVRYREHPNRKHGKRPDRYWSIYYWFNKKDVCEGVGWWSEGVTQAECERILTRLKENQRWGQGPMTWKEMRSSGSFSPVTAEEPAEDKNDGLTMAAFFERDYLPKAKMNKAPFTVYQEARNIRSWLAPVAKMPLNSVTTADLENLVVAPMMKAGKSPRTIKYATDTFCVVWNTAKGMSLVSGDNPATTVKRPRQDNKRVRFLSRSEAAELLAVLKERSMDVHDLALLSLFSGLRRGECLDLTWAEVDLDNGLIFVKDTKTGLNRHAYIIAEIQDMLNRRQAGQRKTARVFPKISQGVIWSVFTQAVQDLGLNDGITDRRQKLVFHSLRHTFASWLVQMGKPLYTVSKLMGHSDVKMTMRYAHLAPDTQRAAAKDLENFLS